LKKLISFLLVLIISLFTGNQFAYSIEDDAMGNSNTQIEEKIDNKFKDDSAKSSSNKDDIFGDEQTFPFVAGLGKNAAH
tara:strand:+ start:239 stop:475 length:237 start_codon:yes stop_codon:yes gene_type:complete